MCGEERDTTLNLGKEVLVANKFIENQLQSRGQTTKIVTGALMTIFSEMDKKGKLVIPDPKKKRALEGAVGTTRLYSGAGASLLGISNIQGNSNK